MLLSWYSCQAFHLPWCIHRSYEIIAFAPWSVLFLVAIIQINSFYWAIQFIFAQQLALRETKPEIQRENHKTQIYLTTKRNYKTRCIFPHRLSYFHFYWVLTPNYFRSKIRPPCGKCRCMVLNSPSREGLYLIHPIHERNLSAPFYPRVFPIKIPTRTGCSPSVITRT